MSRIDPVAMELTRPAAYQRHVMESEKEKLTYFKQVAEQEQHVEKQDALITNLSLTNIASNLSLTLTDILSDIIERNGSIADILTRGDRMIYIGLLLVMISFAVYLIDF
jgi:uncharacterized membrane protein YgaE (UPF0421/DUF939 family)